jgi:NAD(P) transhydrogenase subunit alpha
VPAAAAAAKGARQATGTGGIPAVEEQKGDCMALTLGVPKETVPGESRVALVPAVAEKLAGLGVEVLLESGAGAGGCVIDGGFIGTCLPDEEYPGVVLVGAAEALAADIVFKVQPPTGDEIGGLKEGGVYIGMLSPSGDPWRVAALRDRRVTSFAMELLPRISRAQSMDVLTSQASVAGYKAALLAADLSARFFPMLTTPAGTIRPAKVLVLGVGVAGLQAIATVRRLGAVVEAYDVRSVTREQVRSLGGRFLDMPFDAETEGGYARELTLEEREQVTAMISDHVAAADAVITTAAVPGRPAPRLVTRAMVERMKCGAVIVDLAAEGGGNCELTQPGRRIMHGPVTIYGPLNVPAMLPVHASDQYARNLLNFLTPMIREGAFAPDWDDEVVADTCLTRDGAICHEPTRMAVEGGAPSDDAPGSAS